MTPKESIEFFISSIAETCESHPASTCIVNSYEVLTEDSAPVRRVKEIFNSRSDYLTDLVEKGQRDGSIIGEFCSEYLSDMIIGLVRTTIIKWRMSGFSFSLKARTVSALELLLSRFLTNKH